jgi:hypothetical protein
MPWAESPTRATRPLIQVGKWISSNNASFKYLRFRDAYDCPRNFTTYSCNWLVAIVPLLPRVPGPPRPPLPEGGQCLDRVGKTKLPKCVAIASVINHAHPPRGSPLCM